MLEAVKNHTFVDTILSWLKRMIEVFKKHPVQAELIKMQNDIQKLYKQAQKQGFADGEVKYSKDVDKSHTSYDKPITARDIEKLRSIGKKSINDFIAEDLQKVQKWAYKFYKELNIKSPFFRAWFGDWRAYDTSPAYVVSFAYGENKKLNYTKRSVRCDELNANIIVDETVINDSLSYAKKNGDEKQIRKLLGKVDDILSMGILLDTQVSQKNTGHKKGSTQFMHYLYTPISINGAPFVAKLCIEEYGFNESKRAYNLQRLKISEVSRAQYSQLIDENRGKYAYTSDALSVAQLFEFVKQKDKKFKPNPVNQVLLNEDGTPKVFYHGTRENFTEFSKKKVKPGFYGRGFYFTTEKTQSNVYGESMEVFLRIENPLMPNGNKITLNQIVRFLEAIAENEDYSIENYGTYDINEIASRITNRDVFSVIQDINATAIGDFGEAMQLFNVVNGTNFDGVITPTETVVYDNTQIKSATDNIGTFDKSDPNIRYSLDIPLEGEVYDTIPPGEKAARKVRVPKKVDGTYTNRFVRTIMEHGDISEFQVELLKDGVWHEAEKFRHKVADDKSARN